jgi:hypothetical protein
MFNHSPNHLSAILSAALFVTGSCVAQLPADVSKPASPAAGSSTLAAAQMSSSRLAAARSSRATSNYKHLYGVEIIGIRPVSSGAMVRLSYRVVDPVKAKPFVEKEAKPYLIEEISKLRLEVPVMEKIGQLRQSTSAPKAGREYWMIFQNNRGVVKSGSRVDFVIGHLRMNGLVVD